MSAVAPLLTADDLWELPRDGRRYELIRGELRTMPPAGFEHGAVGINLTLLLAQHVKAHKVGVVVGSDTGFFLAHNPDTVRAPDIAFVRQQRIDAVGIPKKFWDGAPDLAVEVVSPGDTVFEVDDKVQEWLAAGTLLVWVVNPRQRTVTVYRPDVKPTLLTASETLDGQTIVPGFSCRVADIFV